MARNDWYKRATWTRSDQEAFFARLNRSRSAGTRDQYLRIQALHLQRVGTEEMLRAAIDLLDLLLEQSPNSARLAAAYLQKAECLLGLGDEAGAIEYFRKSIENQRGKRGIRNTAALEFSWMIVERGLADLYDKALQAIQAYAERPELLIFPYEHYAINAVRAVIADERGDDETAGELARTALECAAQAHSGPRDHPRAGLVKSTDDPVHNRLLEIAGAQR